ncbi:hypothetical protein [Kribbella pratensis]|uniref:hypothetical protein n=1 Tax=Kribbella pratensis TaxID=2512112 RepID=UPI001064C845|nr:hypothetical protein [Kribbella pratensis]
MSDELDDQAERLRRAFAVLPKTDEVRAVITGLIHPNRLGWMFDNVIPFSFGEASFELSVHDGQFNVLVVAKWPDDPATFLNDVGTMVQGCVDSLGFCLATPLRAEILSMSVEGRVLIYRASQWPDLLDGNSSSRVEGERLEPLTSAAINEPLLRLALADLRAAQESAVDTVMLCYRAIESIRQWFAIGSGEGDNDRKRSWQDLRDRLEIDREDLDALRDRAQARRHGGTLPVSFAERLEALRLARRVVEKFVAYRQSTLEAEQSQEEG